MPKAAGMEKTQ